MSGDALAQLVFFAVIAVILVRAIAAWARRAREVAEHPGPEVPWRPQVTIAPPRVARPAQATVAAPVAPPRARPTAPPRRATAPAIAGALRHADRASLRRAFLLKEILGPPRALDDLRA